MMSKEGSTKIVNFLIPAHIVKLTGNFLRLHKDIQFFGLSVEFCPLVLFHFYMTQGNKVTSSEHELK